MVPFMAWTLRRSDRVRQVYAIGHTRSRTQVSLPGDFAIDRGWAEEEPESRLLRVAGGSRKGGAFTWKVS